MQFFVETGNKDLCARTNSIRYIDSASHIHLIISTMQFKSTIFAAALAATALAGMLSHSYIMRSGV